MKKRVEKRKVSIIYIIAALLIIGLLLAASLYIQNSNVYNPEIKDLPDNIESKIEKLVINEILSNNNGSYLSEDNELCDYIELYNGSDVDINLYGCGLTDSETTIKWAFPNVSIQAKGYLIINLVGKNTDGLNANFKLNKKGNEKVILVRGNNKIIDAVSTVQLDEDQCMGRDEEGNWQVYNYITPGQENSLNGRNAYLATLDNSNVENVRLVINELLVKNNGNFVNEQGVYAGYIEIKNISNEVVNLKDYWLSNTYERRYRYQLPDYDLQPNELYVFYTGENSLYRNHYLGFNFNSKDGYVILSYKAKTEAIIEYNNLSNGLAYILDNTNNYQIDSIISCGYENNTEGIRQHQDKYNQLKTGLIISEVMSSNYKYLYHNNGYYDWVELYNNTDEAINLNEYYISNDYDYLTKNQLPAITLQPHEYFVLMCSGNPDLSINNYYHLNFKIGDTESIFLSKNKKIVDSILVSNIPTGYSYGINLNRTGYYYIETPTPNAANNNGYQAIAYSPTITKGGVYNNVANVVVSMSGEGTIYYTTDGSYPTSNAKKYSGPLTLTKTTVLRVCCIVNGKRISETVNESYIINENHTMDVISLITTPQAKQYLSWRGIRNTYQGYVQFFEEGGSFSSNCGIEQVGNSARYVNKKGLQLKFSKQYGASDLVYNIFENRNYNVFDKLVIRASSTEYTRTQLRDILATTLMDDYGTVDVLAQRNVILYVNGEYYGIFSIREKNDPETIARTYNVPTDGMNFCCINGECKSGNFIWYKELCNFAENNDLTIQENYDYMCSKIDMENFCDYWVAMSFTSNNDLLNIRFYTSPYIADGKMRYIFYDYDWALQNTWMDYMTQYLTNPNGMGINVQIRENYLFRNLIKNKDFQNLYLTRMGIYVQKVWNSKVSLQRLNELIEAYKPEIARDLARYNLTMANWEANLEKLEEYLRLYPRNWLRYTKSYFGLTNAQMKGYFGNLW